MQFADLDLSRDYSYADYLKWTFEERLELIKGKLFKMSPAPSRIHQKISWEIAGELRDFLKGKPYEAYSAPFDVRAPDIMIEILSPGNNKKELADKYEVYEESGVKEYWLFLPQEQACLQYVLSPDGRYIGARPLTEGNILTTPILPGFTLNLEEIFSVL